MARPPRLTPAHPAALRLLLILAAVLLAHAIALQWLARQQAQASALQPLAPPMFTRLLKPQEPPAVPVQQEKRPLARTPSARVAINSVATAPSTPSITETLAVAAAPALPEPAPVQEPPAPEQHLASASETVSTTIASATTTAALDSWPTDTRLNYRLGGRFRSGELYGTARVQWQRDGSRYQVRAEIDLTMLASLVMTSQGEVTPQALVPRVYEELRRSGPRGARLDERTITLANGTIVLRPAGVQDTASQFVELAHRFATGQNTLELGQTISFWMARPGAVDLWTYDVIEREMLATPQLGQIEAFRLVPRPLANPRGNITAEMWFAPSLQYLPVRIRVSMGSEAQVDLIVESIEQK